MSFSIQPITACDEFFTGNGKDDSHLGRILRARRRYSKHVYTDHTLLEGVTVLQNIIIGYALHIHMLSVKHKDGCH